MKKEDRSLIYQAIQETILQLKKDGFDFSTVKSGKHHFFGVGVWFRNTYCYPEDALLKL
jgi:hypothetical protein